MLNTTVAGVFLQSCIYNASGPRTGSIEALGKIAESQAGAILSKSATLQKQDGNPLPRFVNKVKLGDHCMGSLNSEGLPNAGIDYCKIFLSLTIFVFQLRNQLTNFAYSHIGTDIDRNSTELFARSKKPYIVSISGLSLADNLEMLNRIYEAPENIAAIELNLACPNIPGKPVISNDFEQLEDVLKEVTEHPKYGTVPLGIKLAPYLDMPFFEKAATIIAKYPIRYVVCINTIGNALFIDADNECESIAPKNGLGGLGGGFVKHTALANVRVLSGLLAARGREDIDIVGVGGVQSGRDAFELILCGARAVQVGTCHWTEGPSCFGRIAQELEALMTSKGYTSIEDFRGKLKPYTKPTRVAKSSDAGGVDEGEGKVDTEGATKVKVPWRALAMAGYFVLIAIIVGLVLERAKRYQLGNTY